MASLLELTKENTAGTSSAAQFTAQTDPIAPERAKSGRLTGPYPVEIIEDGAGKIKPQTDALPAELRSPQMPLEYHVSRDG
jgi:hypothetical protein